ncbi:hypothetical protein EKO27_g6320 [Xylaria grammica]|uniref:Major facilitator superfamily (MFS) profile domain-containing protein n=1 Tax=Xylaria grammica TaxID=363999 RepID=A0A439D306_9PEZI|nr:hypothetical protein EKO27_g6320 [Xylaria grammica]
MGKSSPPLGSAEAIEHAIPNEVDEQSAQDVDAGGLSGLTLYEKKYVLINREIDALGMVLLSSAFGPGLGASGSYTTFQVLTAFVGFGVGGNVPIDTTIMLEFVPQNRRFLLAALSILQPIGVVLCSAIAFGFIPTRPCSPKFSEPNPLPSCFKTGLEPVFFLRAVVFRLKESSEFLIYKDRSAEAIVFVHYIAKNGRPCDLILADFEKLTGEDDSTGASSTRAYGAKQLVVPWTREIFFAVDKYKILFDDFWGFTVAGTYLPQILALKNGSPSKSLQFTYASYIYTYAPGVASVLLGAVMYRIPSIGRKWIMTLSSGLMGASIFLFATVDTVPKNLGLFDLEYFFQSVFNTVLYGRTPRGLPASVRGHACGIASFWGRLFGIIGPLIAQKLLYASSTGNSGEFRGGNVNAVLYLAGGITMGCVITAALLSRNKLKTADETY